MNRGPRIIAHKQRPGQRRTGQPGGLTGGRDDGR